jgi:penicillin-binding protein 1C
MQFIYPEPGGVLYLPRQMDGSEGAAVFQLAHSQPEQTVWWHLDGNYIGETSHIHQMTLSPAPGKHTLLVVDASGETAAVAFTIAENK